MLLLLIPFTLRPEAPEPCCLFNSILKRKVLSFYSNNWIMSFIYSTSIYWMPTMCQPLFSLISCFPYQVDLASDGTLNGPDRTIFLETHSKFPLPAHALSESLSVCYVRLQSTRGGSSPFMWHEMQINSFLTMMMKMMRQCDHISPGLKKSVCVFFITLPTEAQKAEGGRSKPK